MRKIAIGKGDDQKTDCLLDSSYFKENYEMIAIDSEKLNKLILQQIQIEQEIQECFLLLKKQKKLCYSFHKEL